MTLADIRSGVEADEDDVDAFMVQLLYDGFLAVVPGERSPAGVAADEPEAVEAA